jgi:hypothetical protein
VDEKAGTVHIPIEHAMDLLVQRGLPVRPQGADSESGATETTTIATDKAASMSKANASKATKK